MIYQKYIKKSIFLNEIKKKKVFNNSVLIREKKVHEYNQMKSESSLKESVQQAIALFHDAFRQDEQMNERYANILINLLSTKAPITPSSIFDDFYNEIVDDYDYLKIIELFQNFYMNQEIVKKRKIYLIAHWLYYSFSAIKKSAIDQKNMDRLQKILEKKASLKTIIEEMANQIKIDENQIKSFKLNLERSRIYPEIQKLLEKSGELSEQKAHERHQELTYIIKDMKMFAGIVEYELQKHILVQFQKRYNKNSSEGQEARKQLMPIKQLIQLFEKNGRMNDKIKNLFNQLKMAVEDVNKYNLFEGIKKQLTVLDVYLLRRLIKLSMENITQQNGKASYKNIALFIGPSGSGKTTIILSLLGYNLIETEIEGLQTLQPENLKPEHQALRTSPESTSTTRYMFSVKFPKESFPSGSQTDLYACDSPGFEDTAGVQVDISNSIGILECLRKCASVKLVIVISQRKVGEKMEGIREIANIISNIVVSYKEIQDSVTIVLNKFNCNKEYERLAPGIQNILKNLTPAEKAKTQYAYFLRSLQKIIKKSDDIRFDPKNEEIKKQLMGDLIDNSINNPKDVFKYSISTKSGHLINSRRTLLVKLIKQNLGKKNQTAFYYFNELRIFGECLRQNREIQDEIQSIKKFIDNEVSQKFKIFQKRIANEIMLNDANNATFSQINKISDEIKGYQIFTKFISNLVTSKTVQAKIEDVKKTMIQNIQVLSYQQDKIEETKHKIICTIKFFRKFQIEKIVDVHQRLINAYKIETLKLNNCLNEKRYIQLKKITIYLKNMFEVIEKVDEEMRKGEINPEKILLSFKDQLSQIRKKITSHFEQSIQKSTQSLKFDPTFNEIRPLRPQNITTISEAIAQFEALEEEGLILNEISPRTYKNLILKTVADYGKRLIEQSNKILDPNNTQGFDDANVDKIKTNKVNTLMLKSINGIYGIIGEQIDRLWTGFQRFIAGENQRLNAFLDDLKTNKTINRKNLKNFKTMIDRIVKFSQGDEILVNSVNKLKTQIKKSLVEHIKTLKAKVDKMRLTIKLKRSLESEQISKIIENFKEIEAFYKIKQFNNKDYFAVNNDAEASKLKNKIEQSDDESDVDQVDISEIIENMYRGIIQKLLNPFKEINQESKKYRSMGMSSITLNYLKILDDFLEYKKDLEEMDITFNKDFLNGRNELMKKEDNYIGNVGELLARIRDQFQLIYIESVINEIPEKQIYKLQISKIKQFKKFVSFVLRIQSHTYLQELFLEQKFFYNEYIEKIIEIIKKSQDCIHQEINNRKQNQIDYINKILILKEQIEEMKFFDELQFHKQMQKDFEFTKIYNKITEQIKNIEGRQANAISYLFKDDTIIISDIRNMYHHLSQDELKNEQKLIMICNHLKEYGSKLKKSTQTSKEQFTSEESLSFECQTGHAYIIKLQKAFNFYESLSEFINPKFMEVFTLNENYFASQISDLEFEQKIRQTYYVVKGKLHAFEYKSKPRDFEKVFNVIKRAEYIVSKMTKDAVYSKFYAEVQLKEQSEVNAEEFKANKFSQRLKYYQLKCNNQFNNTFVKQDNQSQIKNKEEFLYQPNFFHMYNKVPEEEKNLIDARIDEVMTEKLGALKNSYQKSEQQRAKLEEEAKKVLQRLPIKSRNVYRDKMDVIHYQIQQKVKVEMNIIRNQLNASSGNNIFGSVLKFEQVKNPTIEKECKNILEKQLKLLVKDIITLDDKKKLKLIDTFKKYLKHFGRQNMEMITKIKNNEKLKQIFESQEKSIYSDIIYEGREIIRQIEGQMMRRTQQGISIYEKRCLQMNEFYMLGLEEDYQGMCKAEYQESLKIWEKFVMKMKDKIKEEFSQCPPIILSGNPPSTHIQNFLIELKFIRIFIDCFTKKSKQVLNNKNKRYQFVQFIHRQWENYKNDQVYFEQLKREIITAAIDLKGRQFYDDLIKVLNVSSLQIEFEKNMQAPLKTIREYEQLYNNYLIQREEDKFTSQQLTLIIQKKWDIFIKDSFSELQSAIAHLQEQISPKILVLYNLSNIISKKKWCFIDKALTSKENVEEFLSNTFNNVRQGFYRQLQQIDMINQEKQNIFKKYNQIKRNAQELFLKKNQQTKIKKEELQKKISQTVDEEARERLELEFQNIERLNNEQIQSIKTKNYEDHQRQRFQNDEALKNCIKGNIVKQLIIMKKFIQSVNWKSKENGYAFAQCLQNLNRKSKEINEIIYKQLQASNNSYGLIIAAESDIFKSQAALEFKNKTSKQDIHYIISKCPQINNDEQIKEQILKFYALYSQEYNRIIDAFKKSPDSEQIDIVAKQLRDQKDRNDNRRFSDNIPIPVTIARVFAIWSMMKVDLTQKSQISIDFMPHPAQIVAIFLLTGFNSSKLANSLIEVLTGEGKSIVLAGLCCYLALKGYFPYCACYSEYLSSRDERQFKDLFQLLQINQRIKYGTFNMHCQDIINEISGRSEKGKTFRDHMRSVIMNKADKSTFEYFSKIFDPELHKRSKKVLIIDEADVFFNENFFGRLYCPSLSLEDEQIKALIQFIWKRTKESRQDITIMKITKEEIYQSEEFVKVSQKYPIILDLIKNQVIGMLQGVYNYQHGYIIHQESIKYRDNDSITDKISYGYKTVFAHCYQYERKAISQLAYNSALKITLNVAPFSYSELPTFFQAILGVSGTVNSMSDYKRQMLGQKYHIEDTYQIPSIYGDSQRTLDKFTIVKDDQYYDELVAHTKMISETKRPIALFFKTIKDVTNFYKSPQFKQFTKHTTILSQQTDHELRETIIKRVGQHQKITIMTESFARGTDFKIFDKRIDEKGGLHVIQTFISNDLSEYIQTRGRTARQGNKGSFEVLINQTELQKFEIVCNDPSQFEEKMKNAWKKRSQIQCQQLRLRVENSKEKHQKTEKLFRMKPSKEDIIQFIFDHNKCIEIRSNHVRTLIGIDGTISMGVALEKVTNILENSFARTKSVLQSKNVSGSFENAIAVYRNYNSDFEQLLEYSGFENDSENLKNFLSKVKINGGWGNEAMQVLFQLANKLNKLDQIILIADAKSNDCNETKFKRKRDFGEDYWIKNGFPLADEAQQVIKLKNRKIKIHTLYIYLETNHQIKKNQLKQYCEKISNLTEGTATQLKVKDESASDFLTAFLVKNILNLIGGQQKGKELMESYDKEFGNVPMRL